MENNYKTTARSKMVNVIKTEFSRGRGTPDDLSRMVTLYSTLDGVPICEIDPCDKTLIYAQFEPRQG